MGSGYGVLSVSKLLWECAYVSVHDAYVSVQCAVCNVCMSVCNACQCAMCICQRSLCIILCWCAIMSACIMPIIMSVCNVAYACVSVQCVQCAYAYACACAYACIMHVSVCHVQCAMCMCNGMINYASCGGSVSCQKIFAELAGNVLNTWVLNKAHHDHYGQSANSLLKEAAELLNPREPTDEGSPPGPSTRDLLLLVPVLLVPVARL